MDGHTTSTQWNSFLHLRDCHFNMLHVFPSESIHQAQRLNSEQARIARRTVVRSTCTPKIMSDNTKSNWSIVLKVLEYAQAVQNQHDRFTLRLRIVWADPSICQSPKNEEMQNQLNKSNPAICWCQQINRRLSTAKITNLGSLFEKCPQKPNNFY